MKKLMKNLIPIQITITKRRNSFLNSKTWFLYLTIGNIILKLFIAFFFCLGLYSFWLSNIWVGWHPYYRDIVDGSLLEIAFRLLTRACLVIGGIILNIIPHIDYLEDDTISKDMYEINDITTPLLPDDNKVQDFKPEVSNDKEEIYSEFDKHNGKNISPADSKPIEEDIYTNIESSNRPYTSKSDVDLLQSSSTLIENGLNYVNSITPLQWVFIGGGCALTAVGLYYAPSIWTWGVGLYHGLSKNLDIDTDSDCGLSDVPVKASILDSAWNKLNSLGGNIKNYFVNSNTASDSLNSNRVASQNLDKIADASNLTESTLNSASTVIKNLNKTVSTAEQTLSALTKNMDIAMHTSESHLKATNSLMDSMQANLESARRLIVELDTSTDKAETVLHKAKSIAESVENVNKLESAIQKAQILTEHCANSNKIAIESMHTGGQMLNNLSDVSSLTCEAQKAIIEKMSEELSKHYTASSRISEVEFSASGYIISCPLEFREVFNNFPLFPLSLIVIIIISFYLLRKLYKTKNCFQRGYMFKFLNIKPNGYLFKDKIKHMQYRKLFYTLNQIHKLKWFVAGFLTSWYLGLFLDVCSPLI